MLGLAVILLAFCVSPLLAGSVVEVDQISSDSAVAISQSGTENQLLLRVGSRLDALPADRLTLSMSQAGSLNTMSIEVGAGAHDSAITASQDGDFNLLTIRSRAAAGTISAEQRGEAKSLAIDVAVAASNSLINVSQSGVGAHVGEITLLSSNQNVLLSQTGGLPGGGGGHIARVTLDGDSRGVEIRQSGLVPREISVNTVGQGCLSPCAPLVFRQD